MTTVPRLALISLITVAMFVIGSLALYVYGRSLWHPLLVKIIGGRTEAQVLTDIEARKPYLKNYAGGSVTIIAFKDSKRLLVLRDHALVMEVPILAASGTLGPKTKRGDKQVPEGIYSIDALNGNSSYYLSLRISYPNARDVERSQKLGITDLGGDIYIHGKSASIGCLALGDDKIEDLFYLAAKSTDRITVIIAPLDLRYQQLPAGLPEDVAYAELRAELSLITNQSTTSSLPLIQ